MVNFLLLVKNIPEYNKKTIDTGQTPPVIYELCSCIRESFCLSYSIRKDNNLLIFFEKDRILVNFIGDKLRYLGPDERSQALLLEKALRKAKGSKISLKRIRTQSTPGIYVSKFFDLFSFLDYINSMYTGQIYLIIDNNDISEENNKLTASELNSVAFLEGDLFIIPTYEKAKMNSKILDLFKQMKTIKFLSLSKITQIENKILYINYRKDLYE
ncbi:MAG: hypothetical protein ACFFCC_06425 [Promethearchaeota archaeon]